MCASMAPLADFDVYILITHLFSIHTVVLFLQEQRENKYKVAFFNSDDIQKLSFSIQKPNQVEASAKIKQLNP